ncbi:MAG: hypothetical protein WA099_10390 [Sulfuricurvum sp.]
MRALENLALGYADGHHIILGNRDTIQFISELEQLDKRPKSLYKKIYSSLTEYGNFLNAVEVYLKITNGPQLLRTGKCIETPLIYFSSTRTIQPTNILCEHIHDIEFFKKITNCYVKKTGFKIQLQYTPQMGGGSAMGGVYASIQSDNKICLAIADSDRYHQNDFMKDTPSTLLRENDPLKPLSNIYILPVREIENLLTATMISNMIEKNHQYCNLTSRLLPLSKMEKNGLYNEIKYIDFKEGMTYKNYLENLQSHGVDLLSCCAPIKVSCNSEGTCQDTHDCNCILFEGLGSNIINLMTEYIEKLSCIDLKNMVHDDMQIIWNEIALKVMSWCCGSRISRT